MRDVGEHYQVLHSLADITKPTRYLEIGVREGASLISVLAQEQNAVQFAQSVLMDGETFLNDDIIRRVSEMFTPRKDMSLYLFDNWTYKGGEGGRQRVEKLITDGFKLRIGHYDIFDGDSQKTLPKFLENTKEKIDLVLVDGDHSVEGATADLENLRDRFNVLVMHDLYHPQHGYLENLFLRYVRANGYPYFIVGRERMGTGVCFNI